MYNSNKEWAFYQVKFTSWDHAVYFIGMGLYKVMGFLGLSLFTKSFGYHFNIWKVYKNFWSSLGILLSILLLVYFGRLLYCRLSDQDTCWSELIDLYARLGELVLDNAFFQVGLL
jgi:hypothetical protein